MIEMNNCLIFGTPNGLSIDEMKRVKDVLMTDFDWLCENDFTVKEIKLTKQDGVITFVFDHEPYEQVVSVVFGNNGNQISVLSNDADIAIRVYNSITELDWGWIEV